MDEHNLKQLQEFGLAVSKKKTLCTVKESLFQFKQAATNLLDSYDSSIKQSDDLIAQYVFAGSLKYFADYVEIFKDLITYYAATIDSEMLLSLLDTVKYAKRKLNCSDDCKELLNYLYERNSLIHDYNNREFLEAEYKKQLDNNSDAFMELYGVVFELLNKKNLLDGLIK